MRYPDFMPGGGTIGYLAPSFGCGAEPYLSAFHHATEKFEKMGYRQVFGPNCYAGEGVGISSTPEKCGQEVMDSFLSEESDCLISCGGGELMCEILPYVDFGRLAKARPTWFMGYSDNTNLTHLLVTLADTAVVYGPCAAAFGMEPWHESLRDAMRIFTGTSGNFAGESGTVSVQGEKRRKSSGFKIAVGGYDGWEKESLKSVDNPLAPYNVTEPLRLRSYMGSKQTSQPLRFRGRLLGGCMDCLANLPGTRFDRTAEFAEYYQKDGIIWFLEACELNVFAIRRAMWQMEESGWFRHVRGFLIGRPANGGAMMNLDAYGAVLEVAGRKGVPVVMDVDLGHLPPMMPLVAGSVAEVTAEGNHIRIEMEFL